MSSDIYFHAELRTDGCWSVVPSDPSYPAALAGEFAWIENSVRAADLFFGEQALIPFKAGAATGSPLHERLEREWPVGVEGTWDQQYRPAWIAFADLMLDSWNDRSGLVVSNRVQRIAAPLFGAGDVQLPERELLDFGWSQTDLGAFMAGARPVDEAIDWDQLLLSQRVAGIPPGFLVEVTWRTSIASLVGDGLARAFERLRGFGADEDLRIVVISA